MGPVVTFSHGWPLNPDAWGRPNALLSRSTPFARSRTIVVAMAGSAKSLLGTIWTAMPTILQPGLARSISKPRVRRPLHARRPSRPLHWTARNEAGQQSSSCRRRAAHHVEVRAQSGGLADGSLRQTAERYYEGPLAILQGCSDAVLWRRWAGGQGLSGHSESVLAMEHAGWPQERL